MTADGIHPLRTAYMRSVRKLYKAQVGGDKDPCRTEMAAKKINALGLDYVAYVDVALKLLEPTMRFYGWPYPYWNSVISDKTIAKVQKLMRLTPSAVINDNLDSEEDMFEAELSYAIDYVEWWFGRGDRPKHCIDVPQAIKTRVAEYLCRMWGIPHTSSNYNVLCEALENHGH